MKKIFNTYLLFIASLLVFSSCQKEEDKAILNVAGAVPSVKLSASSVVLTKDNAAANALTISWEKPNYGFDAPASYTIQIDKKGGTFVAPIAISTDQKLTKSFTTAELNAILLKLGLVPATTGGIDIRVLSNVGDNTSATTFLSSTNSLTATPYLDKIDYSSVWSIVGSATPNGWNGPDLPFYKTTKTDVYVAYVTLAAGDIKFRKDGKWDVNYGDNGADGTTELNGSNIVIKTAGTYKITFSLATLTYTVEQYTWGLVGSATPNGWNGPDVPMTYDPTTDTWKTTVALAAGDFKVRLNNDWGLNYGGVAGGIVKDGANFTVAAGNYDITINFTKMTYTVVASKPWGVVGDATANGWNGPDVKFRPDFFTENVYVVDNITLKDGSIKFRNNDAWTLEYGDNGADGVLDAGGANIAVKAGNYSISMDLSNSKKPVYTLTKK
jgi:hypothetical protein